MPQFKQSEITNTYWATNDGFKGGRDPMGIQNSSIATYGKLLPGLTNLTGHIRYYSLYCWLLSEYDRLERENETSLHQYNFIRRAELALALIMKDQNVGSVVGALFVSQQRYNLIDDGVYDLKDGGDYESKDKYWTYKSGAFGQYYLGSLIHYKLVKIVEGRFYLLDKGKELASAVRKSVSEDARDLYIECIEDGSLAEMEIEDLLPLALNKIVVGSAEWESLNNFLTMRDDDGSTLRRETILLMLKDIEKGISVDNFVRHRFLNVDDDAGYEASFGWYFYYLCEVFHYSIESLFCLILNEIDDLQNPSVNMLLADTREKMLAEIKEDEEYKSLFEWKKNIKGNIAEMYEMLMEYIDIENYPKAAVLAIKLMLRLQKEYEQKKEKILDFENKYKLIIQRGILSEGLKFYVVRYLEQPLDKYIKAIITQVMQEHTIVAIGKMGNSNSDLRKFIFEDGRVVLVEIRYPNQTNPRIDSLYNFLQDMSYIDSEGQLTDIAYNYIENYGKE
jgi:hypothetical protein